MTKIEKAVKTVSDLYEFYRKIPKLLSHHSAKDDEHNQRFEPDTRPRGGNQ